MNIREFYSSSTPTRHVQNAACLAGAYLFRRLNRTTRYIAFTGSNGKTTSRDCLAAILRSRYPSGVVVTKGNSNYRLAQSLMRVKRSDRFALVEIGISQTGEMGRRAATVLPHMAVITKVSLAHPMGLSTLEITAREKEKLLHGLRPGGVAVLNGEDPLVRRMTAPQIGKTVFFGECDGSIARAREIRSSIEEGLQFRLVSVAGEREIQLGLFGVHWVNAVLGAIAAAILLEVPLDKIQQALRGVYAHVARMAPVALPNGAILIRDEYNGWLPSFEAAIAFLKTVEGRRRFVIISEIRYLEDNLPARFAWLAEKIASAAEGVIFVGPQADLAASLARQAGMDASLVHGFQDLREAAARLPSIVGLGDVVLLRGRSIDHLTRLVYAQFGRVSCWKTDCSIIRECDYCEQLGAVDAAGLPVQLPRIPL
ncbi:MAG: UDP-N-acetylmuramoyl-tripeptide--D-alanyl-D-alanine ligase [Acidobacteria bacterium]|nr:UDP-N-acetylmuramoyl-tripeptide--D-alanyl-D-alanine ligase [Acidobacteriota bacterium]MDA1237089.1 UDP-N-acetylmuramoyl-tripeptide--D-alanyl-D-alanine ligase [Acidobacteriota bacterium]